MMYFRLVFLFVFVFCLSACSSRAKLRKQNRTVESTILTHNYQDVIQKRYCGEEPMVRYVSFTYDKADSLSILVNITTSLQEQNISGDITIIVDDYVLEYANAPETTEYEETLEVEIQNRYPSSYRGNFNLVNQILRSTFSKGIEKKTTIQYWNTVDISIESEDRALISFSKDIRYLLTTDDCVLDIYPSESQVEELRKFLR